MELRFMQSFGEIDAKLDSIHHSMGVLSDLVDNNIGIERIWPTRRDWEHDSEEGLATWKEVTEMQTEITTTLKGIARSRMSLSNAVKDNLQVRLTQHYDHLAQIIRADDLMLDAIYLSGKTGSPSPTFQIRGPKKHTI